ncbi:shikimate kinase [Microbacterium lushaniae]|uniref:Shikimate kinase n=1 Tax=Microbacterium lushaniae TaxID=2614639 RepID=A0A5J6L3F9_9MICO|nr:shikimate kinase [Microbacterium lushaniae]QEW03129.1 shikimate kinase [Microbacterium lushaniae]
MPASDTIALIGPMGAGKSSVGRRVAKQLGVTFTDTDAILARTHGPIPDLFAAHGEEGFRRLERDAVREALQGGGVVSLGGGAVLHPDTRADLAPVRVVLLTVDPAVVAGRIRGGSRPLLAGEDGMTRWTEIFQARLPIYEALADVTFDTSRGPLRAVVDAVAHWARASAPTGSSTA